MSYPTNIGGTLSCNFTLQAAWRVSAAASTTRHTCLWRALLAATAPLAQGRTVNGIAHAPSDVVAQPALVLRQPDREEAVGVRVGFGLVVLEQRLLPEGAADNFDLAGDVAHHVAELLGLAVQLRPGSVHDALALQQRHLELVHHPHGGAALEHVVGEYADAGQPVQQRGQGVRIVVDAPEQHRLVAHGTAGLQQRPDGPAGFAGDLPGVVEVGHDDDRLAPAPRPL